MEFLNKFPYVVRVHGDSDLVRIEVFWRPSPEFAETVHIVRDSLDFNPMRDRDRATFLGHVSREGMQGSLMLEVVSLVKLMCQID